MREIPPAGNKNGTRERFQHYMYRYDRVNMGNTSVKSLWACELQFVRYGHYSYQVIRGKALFHRHLGLLFPQACSVGYSEIGTGGILPL